NVLPERLRRQFIRQLSLVPYGITEEIEMYIQQDLVHIAAAEKGRFKLSEVDPIAIISAVRTK
ncbi:hypothetical protein KKI93_24980, partial [Xenorhabdus bovienii]|uniref:hypothetical protein n=1 Tax=Xenorhabdus bovienii TaxID=40576 RepID=UPI0023B2BFEF